jgi:hypothetical protein
MILTLISGFVYAQKEIIISDSLVTNSDMLNVKLGSKGIGKIWKLHFGDYGILTSKKGWTTKTTKGNLLNTRIESKTMEKFSFVLTDKSSDTANVNAANNIKVKAVQEVEIFPHFTWGENDLVGESHNFSAFITINGDTSEIWALFMNTAKGRNIESKSEDFLTNGDRRINIDPAIPGKNSKSMFAVTGEGFEFFESKHSICALQYSGPFGMNKNIVWIYRDFDPKMKLILAATATAILQLKLTEIENQEH